MSMPFTGAYGTAGPDAGALLAPSAQGTFGGYGLSKRKVPVARPGNLNMSGVALSCFIPWLIFVVILTAQSFGLHYQSRFATRSLSALMLLGVIAMGFASVQAILTKMRSREAEPTWYVFLFLVSFLAWVAGIGAGQYNYYTNMLPYYDASNLNTYEGVDPAALGGQQFMDAGRLSFVPDAHLDVTHSMGFRNHDTYCVAPIVTGNRSMSKYDFWAVGVNCCSGHEPDFHCGEYNTPGTFSGLRVMNDAQRPFFRLAVQQAEAAYNMRVDHPVFLYWMRDPDTEINAYKGDGFKFFVAAIFGYLAFQLALTAVTVVVFVKYGLLNSVS